MNTSFNKNEFCRNLTELRKGKGMTQKELAAELGISDKTYSKWETGDTEPDLTGLCRLAEILAVSPAYLLGGDSVGSEEDFINSRYDNLSPAECLSKAFELQFYTIRGLANCSFREKGDWHNVVAEIPPNRVSWNNSHSITSFAATNTYHMMYNGDDANISLSMMPAEDKMRWIIDERELLSDYFSLIGDRDFLSCLRHMISADFSLRYSTDYLADKTGLPLEKVTELLEKANKLGICSVMETNIGTSSVKLYRSEADHMLSGILILAHLSLPVREKNGHYYWHVPAKHTISERA
ncbi:MAG: helix-turn-helix transcriptional regulator [Clostridia bacterium]|nr:helix-turn-helix transcriptional regulator [Clostridia bacterium]